MASHAGNLSFEVPTWSTQDRVSQETSSQPGDRFPVGDRSNEESARRRSDPDLEIPENLCSVEAVRGLLEQWLVPAIVENLVTDLLNGGNER